MLRIQVSKSVRTLTGVKLSSIKAALKAKFHPRRVLGQKVGLTQSCLLLHDTVLGGVGVPGSSSGINVFCANCGATV